MKYTISFDDIFTVLLKNKLITESTFTNSKRAILIDYLTYDSRNCSGSNPLFFCKSLNFKEDYLFNAVKSGAKFYISEKKYDAGGDTEYILVTDIKKAMAIVADTFYGKPAEKLNLTGITGTKGKTTTACFLYNILQRHTKNNSAVISSLQISTGRRNEEAKLSTPESLDLFSYFAEAAETRYTDLVMEVSSQAYKTNRVYGVNFDFGIFLNISEDHISPIEHSDFDDYLRCKMQMFPNTDTLVLNKNTDYYDVIYKEAQKANKLVLYGTDNSADYYYTDIKDTAFTLKSDKINYSYKFKIKIPGVVNIENAAAAIVTAKEMGIPDETIAKAVALTEVPGRMNIIERNGLTVIIDYAHNALSFRNLFAVVKELYPDRRIISLGGVVGGKCYNRRKDFAREVGVNSDYIYLTADDPGNESVESICKEVASYFTPDVRYEIIPDRRTAVEKAVSDASDGDILLLLSKGSETSQKIGGATMPYEGDTANAVFALGKRKLTETVQI